VEVQVAEDQMKGPLLLDPELAAKEIMAEMVMNRMDVPEVAAVELDREVLQVLRMQLAMEDQAYNWQLMEQIHTILRVVEVDYLHQPRPA
jgi:hypothetical protein